MSAEIQLEVETAPVIVLPRSVVTLDTDGTLGVRVLTGDGTVAFLKAAIVDDTPDGLVLSGIPQGTRIIVSGQDIVSDGQKVAAVEAEGGTSAGRVSN
jgi:multidrug efflux system membrane fusion protein